MRIITRFIFFVLPGVYLAAISGSAASIAASVGSVEPARINKFTQPHVLRFADIGDVTSLNPMFAQQLTLSRMSSLTAAWLFKADHENKPYPELATVLPTKSNGGSTL